MDTLKDIVATGWNFDSSYSRLPQVFYSRANPVPVRFPQLVVLNHELAVSLGLDAEALKSNVDELAGNALPRGAIPLAQAYAGHQFGYFTMLGDGRALLLGEQLTPQGERFDVQLKGAGRTPFSRGGDGRAALGPMLREYVISEAMHALGIPTTRSLAVVTTGETIYREEMLKGAILVRVAASHIRVGTFQYAAKWCTKEELQALADYTLNRHFPDFEAAENRYLYLLRQVITKQAALIAKWQLVGFIHGVMNTDNMTVSGETIDYGPCAFMDAYNPDTVFSSIDAHGRYAYGNQPDIGGWNLTRFAEALLPLINDDKEKAIQLAQSEMDNYHQQFQLNWLSGMRLKLGLFNDEAQDEDLILRLLELMARYKADYTNTFLALTFNKEEEISFFANKDFVDWQRDWKNRLSRQNISEDAVLQRMRQSNPAVIPRNHRVEEALDAADQGDNGILLKLLEVLSRPYAHIPEQAEYSTPPAPSSCAYKTYCGT